MATFNPNQAVGPDGKPIGVRQPTTPPPKPPPVNPSFASGASPQAGAWQAERTAKPTAPMGPARAAEGVRMPAASPSVRGTMSWATDKLGAAGRMWNAAAGPEATKALRGAMESPLGKGLQRVAAVGGVYSAATDGLDAKARFDAGDNVGGVDSATKATAGALMAQPFLPGRAVGGAMYAGNAIGNGITSVAEKTETGRGMLESIGSALNFGGPSRDQLAEVNRRISAGEPLGDLVKYAGSSGAEYEAAMQAKAGGTRLPPPNVPAPAGQMGPQPRVNPNQAHNDAMLAATKPAAPAAPTSQAMQGNVVNRVGNDFSGGNVRAGFTYGGEGAPQGITPRYTGPMTLSQEANQRFNNSPSFSVNFSGTPRQQAAAAKAQEERNSQIMKAGDDRELMGMREAGDDRRTSLRAGVESRGQDLRAGVESRGQDVTMRGQDLDAGVRQYAADMNLRGAMAKSKSDATKDQWERDFKLLERNDKLSAQTLEQKAAREKSLQGYLESQYVRDDGNGGTAPDTQKIARVQQGLSRALSSLGADGLHQLQPRAQEQLVTAVDLMEKMRENAGMLPWKPDALKTLDPLDLTNLYVAENGDRVVSNPKSRAYKQVIPARFFDTEEGNRIRMFGTPTNRYDILSQPK